ncbi:hypothetical protein BMS3Abin16_00795 [archaeon BMS3Abin16]|nr:hypothetical protein BMS3Abin16_00795 [archaeon BMS3Abin16]HDY74601.1 hypothetical protein [Euryarchaeota archaeon]
MPNEYYILGSISAIGISIAYFVNLVGKIEKMNTVLVEEALAHANSIVEAGRSFTIGDLDVIGSKIRKKRYRLDDIKNGAVCLLFVSLFLFLTGYGFSNETHNYEKIFLTLSFLFVMFTIIFTIRVFFDRG